MKIRGWSVDGFGLFHDFTVTDLPDGLTVLYGANEAGKSTMLHLLRLVLFGAPSDESSASLAPLQGASHRARVTIAAGSEQLVIERALDRHAAPILRRLDGGGIDAAELPRRLGGADEHLFRTVFTCTLADLHSLAGLDPGTREAIFSASLAGANRCLRGAAQRLRTRAAAQLNDDGSAPINRLIGELNALRPRLNDARHTALAFGDHLAAANRAAAAVTEQQSVLAARRAAQARDAALLHAWPAWQALQAARAELAAIGPFDDVEADVEAELHAATHRLGATQDAVQALRTAFAEAEQRAAAPPAPAAAAESEVEALYTDLPLHRFHHAMLPGMRARCADAAALLAERLHCAGADWSAARLRAWSGARGERERVHDWQTRLNATRQRAQEARWQWETARTVCDAVRRDHEVSVTEVAASTSPAPEEIAQQRRLLGEIRVAIEEMLARRARGEATVQALQEREHALQVLEAGGELPPPKWLAPLFGGVAVGAGGAVVWAAGSGAPLAGLGTFGVAALATAAARWAVEWRRTHVRRQEQRLVGRRTLRSEMEAARRTRDAEWHRAARLAERVAHQAQELGLSRAPSTTELAARERGIDDAAMAAAHAAAAQARRADLEGLLRQREAEEQIRAAEAAATAAAHDALAVEWSTWASSAGFPATATPEAMLDRLAILEAADAALATADSATREVEQSEAVVAAWEARARAALTASGAAEAGALSGHPLIERVLTLRRQLQDDAPRRARQAELMAELHARAAKLDAAEAEAKRCRQRIALVLESAGARDEAALRHRRALTERRRSARRAIAEQERALRERLGDADALAVLESGAIEAWRRRAAAAEEEIGALEQDLYQRIAEHQERRAACRAAEESAQVAALEGEWAALMAELAEAVREWRVLAAAEGLVDGARAVLDRTRQPAVLDAASRIFAAATRGHYDRVEQDDAAQALVVVEPGGRRKQVGTELSRGAAEQLYLSIRLGLAEELRRRGIDLPLLLDDVLVNFDPERARAMAEVLGAFARQQQVLFVTCHPAIRDLLVEYGRAERLINL